MRCDIVGRAGRLCLLLTVFLATASPAIAKDWADGNGNWSVPGNWNPAAVPVGGDAVNIVFNDAISRTVTLDISPPTLGLLSIDQLGAGAPSTLSITSNVSLTTGGLFVGGFTGSTRTAGAGAVVQSAGAVAMASNRDLALANGGPGTSPATGLSSGTYTLSGPSTGPNPTTLTASQSEFIGYGGNATFNQSGGINTINAGGDSASTFNVGTFAGSNGVYNLSGGLLSADKAEVIGEAGTGIFTQTGGTNTLLGINSLYLGRSSGGSGTYTASSTPTSSAVLTVGGDINVGGSSSTGTLNVQGTANVNVTGALNIGAGDHVNLSSGTLRFNGYTRNAGGVFTYTGGTVQLAGTRTVNSDQTIVDIFGASPAITALRTLAVEGQANVNANITVSGGKLQALSNLSVGGTSTALIINNGGMVTSVATTTVGASGSGSGEIDVDGAGSSLTASTLQLGSLGAGFMAVTNGGAVNTTTATIGHGATGGDTSAIGSVTVSGAGSKWTNTNNLTVGTAFSPQSFLNIDSGATVRVGGLLNINTTGFVTVRGATVAFSNLSDPLHQLDFETGTMVLIGSRNLSNDLVVSRFFGNIPTITVGRNLTVEGNATVSTAISIQGGAFKANSLTVNAPFQFSGGVLEIAGGSLSLPNSLVAVPSGGEFRALGTISQQIAGAAGSTITATGNLTLGLSNPSGFYTDGAMNVGTNTVILVDSNDAVFDSGSSVNIGSSTVTPGSLSSANGLTLDFGGNIVGYGTVTTPNTIAKPLINNGHISGASAGAPITLPGYVKGVGTFDNVSFTGTFSPGFSPTTSQVGSIGFSSTSTLVMELGGTTPGSSYDQIQASGALGLGGVLQISLINGFVPSAGQSFDILDWGSLSGTFSSLNLPVLSGLTWNTSQLYTTGVLSVASAGIAGDYNNNGTVDAADYILWRKYQNTTHALPNDPTGGTIGAAQYNTWQNNFGKSPGSGSGASLAAAVPEPTSGALCAMAVVVAFAARRSRK